MKTRQEIKAIGKDQFKANYWNCVLASLLVTVAMGLITWLANGQSVDVFYNDYYSTTFTIRSGFGSILELLLIGPLTVGLNAFFVKNIVGDRSQLNVGTPFVEAFQNYPRKLGGSLWAGLFTFLWSLLFIVPGIIKSISYSMTQYILADCPNVQAKDALKLSMRIMDGHKAEYFVMILSFFGWAILSILTGGLLWIFYVSPYMQSTVAVYYLEVREEALRTGVIAMEQLEGIMPV